MTSQDRIETLLPATYRETYQNMQPTPMRSAALKYDNAGRVAWDDIWSSFCDLAMAGGPPHRGTLLEPATPEEIDANTEKYQTIATELQRGLHLVTGLYARPSATLGWIQIDCTSAAMAAWLCRAILMENVAARFQGLSLALPAGPHFRVEKEIKNVIVAMAKTSHYWLEHMSDEQHDDIARLLRTMQAESPLLKPLYECDRFDQAKQQAYAAKISAMVSSSIGLQISPDHSRRWLRLEYDDIHHAVEKMRIFAVQNILVRREQTAVCLPLNPRIDASGDLIAGRIEAASK